jgi:hypothetical protein
MSQLQYIGARYVPIWYENTNDQSADWQPNVEYEPLTFVTTTNNHLYLSKKTVPDTIGNPADNISYWLDLGVFITGQYQLLQDQIDAINLLIADIQRDVGDLNNFKKMTERSIIVIGNSYVGNTGRECTARLEEIFGHSYRFYSGGVGFVQYTGHTTTFEDLLDNAIASSSFDNDDITDILFVSAIGDTNAFEELGGTYGTDLATALTSINTKITNNFPNVQRTMVTLAESRNVANVLNHNKYTNPFRIHKLFKHALAPYKIEYLGWTGFNVLFEAGNFESDNYHPSIVGARTIGEYIKSAYLGHLEYYTKESQKLVSFGGYQTGATVTIIGYLTPDDAQLNVRVANLTQGNPSVMTANATLISCANLDIPLPGPATSTLIQSKLIRYDTGAEFDNIIGNLVSDSDGVCKIIAGNASTVTAPTGNALCEDFLLMNYKF